MYSYVTIENNLRIIPYVETIDPAMGTADWTDIQTTPGAGGNITLKRSYWFNSRNQPLVMFHGGWTNMQFSGRYSLATRAYSNLGARSNYREYSSGRCLVKFTNDDL